MFGSTWRQRDPNGALPSARAASMYSSTLTLITWARVRRTKIGVAEMPIAIIALVRLGPRNAASAIARIRNGQARKASVRREISASTKPPTKPARQADRHAEGERDRDRDDAGEQRRARSPDDAREHVAADVVGAEPVRRRRRLADRAPAGLDRIERREPGREQRGDDEDRRPRRDRRRRCVGAGACATPAARRRPAARAAATSAVAGGGAEDGGHRHSRAARVDREVGEVGEQVERDVGGRRDEDDALDDGVVAVEDRVDDQLAEAGNGEHLLGQHRAREQRAELERAERDDRRQRIAQAVLQDDDALAQPLGARGADVVGVAAPAASRCACGASARRRSRCRARTPAWPSPRGSRAGSRTG